MIDDTAHLDQEIGIPETCHFSCPVCDKPYRIPLRCLRQKDL